MDATIRAANVRAMRVDDFERLHTGKDGEVALGGEKYTVRVVDAHYVTELCAGNRLLELWARLRDWLVSAAGYSTRSQDLTAALDGFRQKFELVAKMQDHYKALSDGLTQLDQLRQTHPKERFVILSSRLSDFSKRLDEASEDLTASRTRLLAVSVEQVKRGVGVRTPLCDRTMEFYRKAFAVLNLPAHDTVAFAFEAKDVDGGPAPLAQLNGAVAERNRMQMERLDGNFSMFDFGKAALPTVEDLAKHDNGIAAFKTFETFMWTNRESGKAPVQDCLALEQELSVTAKSAGPARYCGDALLNSYDALCRDIVDPAVDITRVAGSLDKVNAAVRASRETRELLGQSGVLLFKTLYLDEQKRPRGSGAESYYDEVTQRLINSVIAYAELCKSAPLDEAQRKDWSDMLQEANAAVVASNTKPRFWFREARHDECRLTVAQYNRELGEFNAQLIAFEAKLKFKEDVAELAKLTEATTQKLRQLRVQLAEVKKIMIENMHMLINRGEKLEILVERSNAMREASERFKLLAHAVAVLLAEG